MAAWSVGEEVDHPNHLDHSQASVAGFSTSDWISDVLVVVDIPSAAIHNDLMAVLQTVFLYIAFPSSPGVKVVEVNLNFDQWNSMARRGVVRR